VPTIELAPYLIEYTLSQGKSRRYTYLRFRSDMTLEVVLPRGRKVNPESEIRGRRAWVLKHFEAMSRNRRILEDDRVMYDGAYLKIVFETDADREEVRLEQAKGVVFVRATEASRVKELVRRWFLRETSRYVVKKLSEISDPFPKYQGADVREIKHWGYCTKSRRLSFSWQLIALPESLREYVLLHELTHLSVFNHSPEFRRRLEAVCPDYKLREKELDQIAPMRSYLSRSL
jgi:predicted metal-dependent hydrolase